MEPPFQRDETIVRGAYRRAFRTMAYTFVVFALLVSTHLGEFWPFSIYPMFSSAGNPWTRSLVHEVPPDTPDSLIWRSAHPLDLPGDVFPLAANGVFQNDLANFVSKTDVWSPDRVKGVTAMFAPTFQGADEGRRLVVYRVRGTLASDGVDVVAMPLMLLTEEGATLTAEVDTP